MPHPNGSYTTFGRCGYTGDNFDNALTVNKYTEDGTQIFANTINIRDHIIRNTTLTGSGYLVHLTSYVTVEFSRILHLDSEGNLLGDFCYESEENDFFVSDICEHNGTVYTTDAEYGVLCRFYANIFNSDGTFKEQKKLDLMTERRWPK